MFPNQAVLGTCNFSGDFSHIFSSFRLGMRIVIDEHILNV